MQQVWAEVYEELYKKGVKYYLDAEEMAALNSRNESHTSDEPIKDLIDTAFNWLAPKAAWNYKSTATDIAFGQVCKNQQKQILTRHHSTSQKNTM